MTHTAALGDLRAFAEEADAGLLTPVSASPLVAALTGDRAVLAAILAVEAGWAAVQPFLDLWAEGGKPDPYAPGSTGPVSADKLIERDGRKWHQIDGKRSSRKI